MFELKMPTPQEHRAASLSWLKRIKPTLIDQWHPDLLALSMPTEFVRLPDNAFELMCSLQDGADLEVLTDLAAELDSKLGWNRRFIRLNSRSPKDWPFPFDVPATMSGKEAVAILSSSERVIEDLMQFKYVPEQPAFVCLREFVPWIRGVNEFRCFVKGGDLIAVTHYDYTKPAPEGYSSQAADIRGKIDAYFRDMLRDNLPMATVVFDVAMDHAGKLLLIEINPYGLSDPCWFGSYEAVEQAGEPVQFAYPSEQS